MFFLAMEVPQVSLSVVPAEQVFQMGTQNHSLRLQAESPPGSLADARNVLGLGHRHLSRSGNTIVERERSAPVRTRAEAAQRAAI